jgi:hypothetical protein
MALGTPAVTISVAAAPPLATPSASLVGPQVIIADKKDEKIAEDTLIADINTAIANDWPIALCNRLGKLRITTPSKIINRIKTCFMHADGVGQKFLKKAASEGELGSYNMFEQLIRLKILDKLNEKDGKLIKLMNDLAIEAGKNFWLADNLIPFSTLLSRNRMHILFDNANGIEGIYDGVTDLAELLTHADEKGNVKKLLEGQDNDDNTPLHIAAYWDYAQHTRMTDALFKAGVLVKYDSPAAEEKGDPRSIRNSQGYTPYELAAIKNHTHAMERMRYKGMIPKDVESLKKAVRKILDDGEQKAVKELFSRTSITSLILSLLALVVAIIGAEYGSDKDSDAGKTLFAFNIALYFCSALAGCFGLKESHEELEKESMHFNAYYRENSLSTKKTTAYAAVATAIGTGMEIGAYFTSPLLRTGLSAAGPLITAGAIAGRDIQLKAATKYYSGRKVNRRLNPLSASTEAAPTMPRPGADIAQAVAQEYKQQLPQDVVLQRQNSQRIEQQKMDVNRDEKVPKVTAIPVSSNAPAAAPVSNAATATQTQAAHPAATPAKTSSVAPLAPR